MYAMKKVVIHSDGGCHGNPGPGGWAATLRHGLHCRELSGGEPATTNNRMELMAAIEGLRALKEPCAVEFHTDSQYVKNGVTTWIKGWKRNGWQTRNKLPVKNEDLWRELDAETQRHQVSWHWVRGHAGHSGNERCDVLAGAAIEKIKRMSSPAQLREALSAFVSKQKQEHDTLPLLKNVDFPGRESTRGVPPAAHAR